MFWPLKGTTVNRWARMRHKPAAMVDLPTSDAVPRTAKEYFLRVGLVVEGVQDMMRMIERAAL